MSRRAWFTVCVSIAIALALFSSSTRERAAGTADRSVDAMGKTHVAPTETAWALEAFLKAEALRAQGETERSLELHRELVRWALAERHRPDSGGSALCGLSLLRWAQALEVSEDLEAERVDEFVASFEALRDAPWFAGLSGTPILANLPQLEQRLVRQSARLLWSAGDRERAVTWFLDYLALATTGATTALEELILKEVVASGAVTSDRLALMRGERLLAVGRYDAARDLLQAAAGSREGQVRAEALLELARLGRALREISAQEAVALLGQVLEATNDSTIVQEALLQRGVNLNREGPGRNEAGFLRDMNRIVRDYPRGGRADDALYELARHYQGKSEVDTALSYYDRLRRLDGPNDWIDSASFQPAIALNVRGDAGDLEEAAALLDGLVAGRPGGPLYPAALFWSGRVLEARDRPEDARRRFERLVEEFPYDYYGLRARMHLKSGATARTALWPDSATNGALKAAFRKSRFVTGVDRAPIGLQRVRLAIATGDYERALGAEAELRVLHPGRRLEELTLEELDTAGLLPRLVMLLALRQDALVAARATGGPEARLALSHMVGPEVGDWSLSMLLVNGTGESSDVRSSIQRHPAYLVTAYPAVHVEEIREAARRWEVPAELLYCVARRESLFYPAALSSAGAIGLFQFMPGTFAALDRRWSLTGQAGTTPSEYLMDPSRNIDLGGRWFGREQLPRYDGDPLLAIMDHNAGYPAVRSWSRRWKELGRGDDVEFMIETARFVETRIFARGVIGDMTIVRSTGRFDRSERVSTD